MFAEVLVISPRRNRRSRRRKELEKHKKYYIEKKQNRPTKHQYHISLQSSPRKHRLKFKPKHFEEEIVYDGDNRLIPSYDGDKVFWYNGDYVYENESYESDSTFNTFVIPKSNDFVICKKKAYDKPREFFNEVHSAVSIKKLSKQGSYALNSFGREDNSFNHVLRSHVVDKSLYLQDNILPEIKKHWNLPAIPTTQENITETSTTVINIYDIESYRKRHVTPSVTNTAQTVSNKYETLNLSHITDTSNENSERKTERTSSLNSSTELSAFKEKQTVYHTESENNDVSSQSSEEEEIGGEVVVPEDSSDGEPPKVSYGMGITESTPGIYCIPLTVKELVYAPDVEKEERFSDALFKSLKGDDSFGGIISEIEREYVLKQAFDFSINFDRSKIRNKKLKKGVKKEHVLKKALEIEIKFKYPMKGLEKRIPRSRKQLTVSNFKNLVEENCTKKDVQLMMGNQNVWMNNWERTDQEEIERFLENINRRPTVRDWMASVENKHQRQSSGSIVFLPPKRRKKIKNIAGETDAERWVRIKAELFEDLNNNSSSQFTTKETRKKRNNIKQRGVRGDVYETDSMFINNEDSSSTKSTEKEKSYHEDSVINLNQDSYYSNNSETKKTVVTTKKKMTKKNHRQQNKHRQDGIMDAQLSTPSKSIQDDQNQGQMKKESKHDPNQNMKSTKTKKKKRKPQKNKGRRVSFADDLSSTFDDTRDTKRNSSVGNIHADEDQELLQKYGQSRRSNRRQSIELHDKSEGRLFGNTIYATPTYSNFKTGWHEEVSLYKIQKIHEQSDRNEERHLFISRSFDNSKDRPSDAEVMAKQADGMYDNGGAYVKMYCLHCDKWESDSCSENENE